ncbi:hypothetical protein TKK_0017663 [Trichogramma kaykai]
MKCEVMLDESAGEFEPIKINTAIVPHFGARHEQGMPPNHVSFRTETACIHGITLLELQSSRPLVLALSSRKRCILLQVWRNRIHDSLVPKQM